MGLRYMVSMNVILQAGMNQCKKAARQFEEVEIKSFVLDKIPESMPTDEPDFPESYSLLGELMMPVDLCSLSMKNAANFISGISFNFNWSISGRPLMCDKDRWPKPNDVGKEVDNTLEGESSSDGSDDEGNGKVETKQRPAIAKKKIVPAYSTLLGYLILTPTSMT